jgi:acetate kinase
MGNAILVVNAGSSSLKFAVYREQVGCVALAGRGQIEAIGRAPRFEARDAAGTVVAEKGWPPGEGIGHEATFASLRGWIEGHLGGDRLVAAGHRVVHGGTVFTRPVRVDAAVLKRLAAFIPLAPLHQPHNLAAVRALMAVHPDLPQIACFDTAFHASEAPVATRFALPRDLYAAGVRRYGFHGLSYEYIARALREAAPELAAGRVVVAHLGNGASMCAMHGGRSVDTTMGFTALDGLPMGTRCGTLDPGVILYLLQQRRMTPEAVEDLLYHRSGLLGISGRSSDMRDLLASDEPPAREAIETYVFRVARELGALTASLGGLDALVFTAGIGEHAPEIRAAVCEHSAWLGIRLDPAANARGGPPVSAPGSSPSVWVIPTDEEKMIALHTWSIVGVGGTVATTE